MVKKQKNTPTPVEKTITIAGLIVVTVGIISGLFNAYTNQRFINNLFPTGIYYFTEILLLGGGLVTGYLLTRSRNHWQKMYSGVNYAFLAYILFSFYWVFSFLYALVFGVPSYPWGAYASFLAPIIALLITVVIASIQSRKDAESLAKTPKLIFVISLLTYQLYDIGSTVYYMLAPQSGSEAYSTPVWITIGSYLISPIIVVIISYLVLSTVKNRFERLYFATIVAAIDYILLLELFNFRIDPSLESTNIFETFVLSIIIIATALLLLVLRRKSTSLKSR